MATICTTYSIFYNIYHVFRTQHLPMKRTSVSDGLSVAGCCQDPTPSSLDHCTDSATVFTCFIGALHIDQKCIYHIYIYITYIYIYISYIYTCIYHISIYIYVCTASVSFNAHTTFNNFWFLVEIFSIRSPRPSATKVAICHGQRQRLRMARTHFFHCRIFVLAEDGHKTTAE